MKDKEREQAQRIINDIQDALAGVMAHVSKSLVQLERLLSRCKEEEERFAEMQQLHEMDCERGDYMHRPNGKRPLAGRFRYLDEEPRSFTPDEVEYLLRRTHREKNDLRQGRQNQGRN